MTAAQCGTGRGGTFNRTCVEHVEVHLPKFTGGSRGLVEGPVQPCRPACTPENRASQAQFDEHLGSFNSRPSGDFNQVLRRINLKDCWDSSRCFLCRSVVRRFDHVCLGLTRRTAGAMQLRTRQSGFRLTLYSDRMLSPVPSDTSRPVVREQQGRAWP